MFLTRARNSRCASAALALLYVTVVASTLHAAIEPFMVGGDGSPASIQAQVDAFRTALGNPNNANATGPLASGRREINWDGGGASVAAPVGTPMTTFQNNRGGTFTTPGTGFLQTPLGVADLTNINAAYATTFGTFSAQRLFTPLGSNITDATFSIPGSNGATPATVAGFGAVFSDVDLANTTKLEFFDASNSLIQTLFAPTDTVTDGGLSFVGGVANAGERIARVRITTGNGALGPTDTNGNPDDVVVMDDFLYSEPIAIPEPASMALAFIASVWAWTYVARRTQRARRLS